MKATFPARFIVESNGDRRYLCRKHMEQEMRTGGKVIESFEGNEIGCDECSDERINN